jgi:hypothetical protein
LFEKSHGCFSSKKTLKSRPGEENGGEMTKKMETLPDGEEIDEAEELIQESDYRWFAENYGRLAEEYEGKFLVIRRKKVLKASETLEEVLEWLKEKRIPPNKVLVEPIAPRSFACIL